MTCGCSLSNSARDRAAAAAAMCAACEYRGHPVCTVAPGGGAPVRLIVSASAERLRCECPLGRHPDRDGVVRWMGIRWVGVPAPVRWWLRRPHVRRRLGLAPLRGDERRFDGCGCVLALKALWLSRGGRWVLGLAFFVAGVVGGEGCRTQRARRGRGGGTQRAQRRELV